MCRSRRKFAQQPGGVLAGRYLQRNNGKTEHEGHDRDHHPEKVIVAATREWIAKTLPGVEQTSADFHWEALLN